MHCTNVWTGSECFDSDTLHVSGDIGFLLHIYAVLVICIWLSLHLFCQ